MKVYIVYAHPNPHSFNHALLESFTKGLGLAGHIYEVADLYGMNFDPRLTEQELPGSGGHRPIEIIKQQDKVSWAEAIVFIYPVWWTGPPAILKGWIDRVFSVGFAYGFDEVTGQPMSLLKHQKALILSTAGSNQEQAEASGMTSALRAVMEDSVFRLAGIEEVGQVLFYRVNTTTDEERRRYLEEAERLGKEF